MISLDIEKNYNKFKSYVSQFITERGDTQRFLDWLDTTDFKTAPASAKYHLNVAGGLCLHSLGVFHKLIKLVSLGGVPVGDEKSPFSRETISIVGLLFDLAKIGYYKPYIKNVKDEATGQWAQVEAYGVVDDPERLIYGTHGDNSIYLIRKFFTLTAEEEIAIRYHHGAFDVDSKEGKTTVSMVFGAYPLALYLHTADMLTTFVDEAIDKHYAFPYEPKEPAPTEEEVESTDVDNTADAGTAETIDSCPF